MNGGPDSKSTVLISFLLLPCSLFSLHETDLGKLCPSQSHEFVMARSRGILEDSTKSTSSSATLRLVPRLRVSARTSPYWGLYQLPLLPYLRYVEVLTTKKNHNALVVPCWEAASACPVLTTHSPRKPLVIPRRKEKLYPSATRSSIP